MPDSSVKEPLLEVIDLRKYFPVEKGFLRRVVSHVRAVDGVNLYIMPGETLGLVGESGSGKTTLGRCVLRAIDPTTGSIVYRFNDGPVDVASLSSNELQPYRRYMQMVFQDPYSSLDPRMTVLDIIGEPLKLFRIAGGTKLRDRVAQLMDVVGLDPNQLRRYPHAFSGGQRQRIGIARALALNPKFVVCDEAVSALDVSIQAQILNLLRQLQTEFDLTYLFIAHDLSVVRYVSDRIAVMYVGMIVESTHSRELFTNPRHPYTEALLSAVPKTDPETKMKRIILQGEIPDPASPPGGCRFHTRCRYAKDLCSKEVPQWQEVSPEHFVACHRTAEIDLKGLGDEIVGDIT